MPKINARQRRGQSWLAGQRFLREIDKLSEERDITKEAAEAAIFADRELLAKIHDVPSADTINPKWAEPQ